LQQKLSKKGREIPEFIIGVTDESSFAWLRLERGYEVGIKYLEELDDPLP